MCGGEGEGVYVNIQGMYGGGDVNIQGVNGGDVSLAGSIEGHDDRQRDLPSGGRALHEERTGGPPMALRLCQEVECCRSATIRDVLYYPVARTVHNSIHRNFRNAT